MHSFAILFRMQQSHIRYALSLLQLLREHYPDAGMILQWTNTTELLIAIMLSAQCTDIMVNKVTTQIFPRYREKRKELYTYYALFENTNIPHTEMIEQVNFSYIDRNQLEQDIRSTGFFRMKAAHIQEAFQQILSTFRGLIPSTLPALITLPGVGRKTANVFLGNAYGIYEGIAVDTHVKKQAKLLKLTRHTVTDKIEIDLMETFDKKDWFELTYLLIAHGRNKRKKRSDRIVCSKNSCLLCYES